MAFDDIEGGQRHRAIPHEVAMGVYSPSSVRGNPEVAVYLAEPVVRRLGWTVETEVQVLEGTGEDEGILLLRPRSDGKGLRLIQRGKSGGLALRVSSAKFRHHTVCQAKTNATKVEYQVFARELKVLAPEAIMTPRKG